MRICLKEVSCFLEDVLTEKKPLGGKEVSLLDRVHGAFRRLSKAAEMAAEEASRLVVLWSFGFFFFLGGGQEDVDPGGL